MARSGQNEEVEANVALLTKWMQLIDEVAPHDMWGVHRGRDAVKRREEERETLLKRYTAKDGASLERLYAKWLTGMHLSPAPDCPLADRAPQSAIANFLGCYRLCLSCQAEARLSLEFMLNRELARDAGHQFPEIVERRSRLAKVESLSARERPTRAESLKRLEENTGLSEKPSSRRAEAPPGLETNGDKWLPTKAAAEHLGISYKGLLNAKRQKYASPDGEYCEDSRGRQSRKNTRGDVYFYKPTLSAKRKAR